MPKKREITFAQAIHEAIDICMERDLSVFIIGEGVPDQKGIFGTTLGLMQKYGPSRVMDMPVSENGLTGICIGAALRGMRPILVHQRIDFALLSFDQLVNNAAKWYYMFGSKVSIPLVIRMIIGRGWGQGSQHSQSLQSIFAHIAGLKVIMPSTPYDAKGLFISAVEDKTPVVFIEHRWLHTISGDVPRGYYRENIGTAKIIKKGSDVTVVTSSYMTIEGLRAQQILAKEGISVELIDVRSIKPFDTKTVIRSVKRTGRILVADTGGKMFGFCAEAISRVTEDAFFSLRQAPCSIGLPDTPTPTSWKLAESFYPTYIDILKTVLQMMKVGQERMRKILAGSQPSPNIPSDVADTSFTGPF